MVIVIVLYLFIGLWIVIKTQLEWQWFAKLALVIFWLPAMIFMFLLLYFNRGTGGWL